MDLEGVRGRSGERTGLKIFEMLKEKNILKMAEEFKTTEFLFTKNHV